MKIRYVVFCVALLAAAGSIRAADAPATSEEKAAKAVAVLRSGAAPADKAIACKQLAVFGNKDAVPALAPYLADTDLASWARIALEAIPGPEADEALRQSLGKLQGRLLIGAIHSVGVRRDAKAVEALAGRLREADAGVASAAAVALGRIGNAPAAQALEQTLARGPAGRNAAALGCILAAERALAEGKADEAARLYDLVRKAEVPKQRTLEATRGAILARKAAGLPLLVEQLRSADKTLFALGLRVARELPGREVTAALAAELGRAAPERQALLIVALADRGDAASLGNAMGAVTESAKSGPETVRIAAVRVLGRLGNASHVPVLLDAALHDNADLSEAAIEVLAELRGQDVTDDLAARLAKAEGKSRIALIRIAGRRQIGPAVPTLIKAADDPDAQVRAAALAALGATIEAKDLPVLIARAAQAKADDAKAAEDALQTAATRMPDRETCAAALIAAMASAPVPVKCKFLDVLSAVGGAKALEAVGAAAKDANPEIQDAASRVLGKWTTADAAPVLLDLAKTSADPTYKIRALRGYLRIARQLVLPLPQRTSMCREAVALIQRPEEKRLVLEILRRYPSADGLSLAVAQLRGADVKPEATSASVAIAEKLLAKNPAAVAKAMKQVVESGSGRDALSKAKDLLEKAQPK